MIFWWSLYYIGIHYSMNWWYDGYVWSGFENVVSILWLYHNVFSFLYRVFTFERYCHCHRTVIFFPIAKSCITLLVWICTTNTKSVGSQILELLPLSPYGDFFCHYHGDRICQVSKWQMSSFSFTNLYFKKKS